MLIAAWFKPPRQLVTVFLLAAIVSTAAIGWLAWQLLASDRIDAIQRAAEDRERTADAAAVAFDRSLATLDRGLTSDAIGSNSAGALPAGTVIVRFERDDFRVDPADGLPYVPEAGNPEPAAGPFTAAEQEELVGNLAAAASGYMALSASGDARVRATALARLGRVRRKQHAWSSALRAYDDLAAYGSIPVGGMPALLVAHLGRASVFETERPDETRLRDEANRLRDSITRGHLRLTRAQYSLCAAELRRWSGLELSLDAGAEARADAFEWFWGERVRDTFPLRGRRLRTVSGRTVLVGWQMNGDRNAGAVFLLDSSAIQALATAAVPGRFAWSLSTLEGELVAGDTPPARNTSTRAGVATGLPWTLHVFPSPAATAASPSSGRVYLAAVLVSVAAVLAAAWFFIWRGIAREARVARLQSDFVAAVSHEFRSPLTSLRHIAELLATDRMPSAEHQRRSYGLLLNEADRLGRLVEGLLDVGRLQDGHASFRFEPVNVPELTREVVENFSRRLDPDGHHVELLAATSAAMATADREALTRVLWNLLDNAVKYSPDRTPVLVDVRHDAAGRTLLVSVTDSGLGIPASEQPHIFERFVRGADAKARRIRGTGIGLSMAREIMRAHAGDITVASAPGQGSTFTVRVPITHA